MLQQPIKNLDGRQTPRALYIEVDLAALVAQKPTANVFEFELPPNSQIVGGDIVVTDVSDDTGTDTLSIGDAGSANRYANAVNLKAAARTALTLTGYVSGSDGTIQKVKVTRTPQNGNATKVKFRLYVLYVQLNRADATQG